MTHPWSQTLTALANLMDASETVKALGETMTFGPDIDPFPPRIYGDNKLDLARVKWALENARSLEMPFRVLAAETKEKMREHRDVGVGRSYYDADFVDRYLYADEAAAQLSLMIKVLDQMGEPISTSHLLDLVEELDRYVRIYTLILDKAKNIREALAKHL